MGVRTRARVALALGALAVSLAVAEVALREVWCRRAAEPSFARVRARFLSNPRSVAPKVYEPARTPTPGKIVGEKVHVNAHGLRGPATPLEKPAGTRRVLCLGGSSVFGTRNTRDELAWPGRLQAALAARRDGSPTVEVLNGGGPGLQSRDSLARLRTLRALSPDVVVLCNVYNDVLTSRAQRLGFRDRVVGPVHGAFARGLTRSALGLSLVAAFAEGEAASPSTPRDATAADPAAAAAVDDPDEFLRPARGTSREEALAARNRALEVDALRPDAGGNPYLYAQDLREYEAGLERFVQEVRAAGGVAVLCTQALAIPLDAEASAYVEHAGTLRTYFPSWEHFRDVFARYNDAVRAVAARTGATLFDGDLRMPRPPEAFADEVHMTDAGAALWADALADVLIERGVIPD